MEGSKIRWTGNTWNPMTGCTQISPGCAHCYAKTIAEKFAGSAFPRGFAPTWKPNKLDLPRRWAPSRVFVNSMSDVFHEAFSDGKIDQVFAVMVEADQHVYQVLTKRPQRMADYVAGWLARRGISTVPQHIWLGTSIENNRFVWRADVLRSISVPVRFISAEPLLGPLPDLDLTGIAWLIVGGESGQGYRPMDHDWARQLRDRAPITGTAYYFKQSAAPRTEMGMELDGRRWEEMPDDDERAARWGCRPWRHGAASARRSVPEAPTQAALSL